MLIDSESDEPPVEPPALPPQFEPAQAAAVPERRPEVIDYGEYKLVVCGSQRGADKLVGPGGFTYNVHSKSQSSKTWQCTFRPRGNVCKARVHQRFVNARHANFTATRIPHSCPPGHKRSVADMVVISKAKAAAVKSVGKSASSLFEEEEMEYHKIAGVYTNMDPRLSANRINKHRQGLRPNEPTTTDFDYDENFLPGFKVATVRAGGEVAHIFSTDLQLAYLTSVRTWYCDATFSVVGPPFKQLWTITGHVRRPADQGQQRLREEKINTYLLYAIMSGKSQALYREIIKAVLRRLVARNQPIRVNHVVLDFERAAWNAVREAFMQMDIEMPRVRGCVFHWCQALYRKIIGCGLANCYKGKSEEGRFLRRLMGLPLIPSEAVWDIVQWFHSNAPTQNHKKVTEYILKTYVCEGALFKTREWSGYRILHRTNNACESNHHRLNAQTSKNLGFYRLVAVLHKESERFAAQATHVSEGQLRQRIRSQTKSRDRQLIEAWDQHARQEIDDFQLLNKVHSSYRPT
mgnify:CR=1 FL=1